MLTVSGLTKSFGGRILFEEASLQINRGDRIGLVGPNGAGKTTLFSLILGSDSPDVGNVLLQRGSTIGFLPQESAPAGSETVLELATATTASIAGTGEAAHEDYHSFEREPKAKRILKGLSFHETDFDRPARDLSGGWVMRAHLARLLVQEPDLLLLDEPTNHLDLEALGWFQNYLAGYPAAVLVISHDREFLNALVDSIVEIRQSQLLRYRGNYDRFVAERAAREEQLLAAWKNQQKEIQRLQEFADRFRAKASKASQAQSKLKQIERMDKIEAPAHAGPVVRFKFPQPVRSGQKVVTLTGVHKAYDGKVVYAGVDFETERGARTVLVGPNGAGKSTLLKILAGVLPFERGERKLGHNVTAGYYAQHRIEMLSAKRTVLQEAQDVPNPVSMEAARTVLGSFLFRGDDVFKNVGVLSGGEKSRLALVKLLLNPPNLLLMDEPTTHLDIPSIDALVGALTQYEGTLVFISHDVYFIRALANHVIRVDAGRLTHYPGGYQYYLDKTKAASERGALVAGNAEAAQPVAPANARNGTGIFKTREQKRAEAEARKEIARVRRSHQEVIDRLEGEIMRLENLQSTIHAQLELPETYEKGSLAMELNRELIGIADSLERLNREWTEAAGKLESVMK